MTVSVRSYLAAGVAAAVVGALAIAPAQPSAPIRPSAESVHLSAAMQPLVNPVNAAAAVLGQNDPGAAAPHAQPQASATANNSASNAIDAAYSVIMYWADYFALDLGPYLLGWVPFGYLISDQIYIWYPTFTVPVADSFVYQFLDPVVNDFWNPAVWRDGLTAVAQTAWSSLGTAVNQEVAYFLSLQWFPIPLPPIPPLPFAALKTPAAAASADAATEQKAETTTVKSGVGHSGRPALAKQTSETAEDTTGTVEAIVDPTAAPDSPTPKAAAATKSAKADKDNPAKTGATKSDTGTKKSTAGSARTRGGKSAKGDS